MILSSFPLNKKEETRLKAFYKAHGKHYTTSATGGKYTYSFTPSGIGTFSEVRCNVCGKSKNITDFNNW